ncbi:MAG: glycerate kinase [Bacteroidia bacterium]|nr:glycerate kinase [Bacteroidia bacterium]
MNRRAIAEQIFLAGVESVIPDKLINKKIALKDNSLVIGHLKFSLESIEDIYVIGAGKASAMMAAEVEKILGNRITEGHVVAKYGHSCKLKYIIVSEAGHPIPDSNGFKATRTILDIAGKANSNDLVICLLSGGGSALLPDFPEGNSPEDIITVNDLLVKSGAVITEINAVRKHLSIVKGGQLARAVHPATLVSLILSDVPGDPLDVIASGPTTPDLTTFQQALAVLDNYNLTASVPAGILKFLMEGAAGKKPETPKPGDYVFEKTSNLLIGSNSLALEAAKQKALEFNINAVIIDNQLQGDSSTVADYIVETSLKFKEDVSEIKPVCLLFGGETTIKMTGKGLGGRNQHLALLCAIMLQNNPGITVLSAGTDGTDGLTNAAGAVVDSETIPDALSKNIDPAKSLAEFDSYHFFKKAGGQIITGPTMTNVMDIIVVIVE